MGQLDEALAVARVVTLHRRLGEERDAAGAAFARRLGQRQHLVEGGAPRRHRAAELVRVRGRLRRRETRRAGRHRLADEPAHVLDLLGRGGALRSRVAHDEAAERRVADVDRGVDPEPAVEDVEEGGKALPVPRQPAAQHRRRHPLDLGEQRRHPLAVLGAAGRDRVAAVPGHHGGDAVIARRGGEGLEGELRVVVRVDVDDAGHDDEAVGVDGAARAREAADVGHEAVADADVGAAHGEAGAVHDRAALDDGVERHVIHPMYFSSLYAPSAHWPPTRPTPESL